MEKQKGFASIVILVVVLVVSVVGGLFIYEKFFDKSYLPPVPATISPIPQATSSASSDETANWKIYTNTKYGFSVKYPNDLPAYNGLATRKQDELVGLETADSILFGCSGFGVGVCDPTFRIGKSSLSEIELKNIFNLSVGNQVDKEITYALGGMWNQKTNYARLVDQVEGNVHLLVFDNPSGYGGSSRIWFLKIGDSTFQFNCRYINSNILTLCQNIISTFKFTN